MYLVMHLQGDEDHYIVNCGYKAMLQADSMADGMNAEVIGGPFLFNLDGVQCVYQEEISENILTHAEALKIFAGDSELCP